MKETETILDIFYLKRDGMSERSIARTLGISRTTVRKYLADPEAAYRSAHPQKRGSIVDQYTEIIQTFLESPDGLEYTATRIYDKLVTVGYTGSYDTVKRKVRQIKEKLCRIAYIRFETEPGRQAQVDFAEFQVEHPDGTVEKYYLFAMILGFSRGMYAELLRKCDLATFLDCHIRAFEHFGGVPQEILYDRMKNVYIGRFAGKHKFNDTLISFAMHYRFKPLVAPAYAAWVKGKVERPFHFIREGFWRGYSFVGLETANKDLQSWLAMKEERVHGTTREIVRVRLEQEKPVLGNLPAAHFDTSAKVYRKVNKDCTVRFECNSYVVPWKLVGKNLVLRVKDGKIRIFDDDRLVVTYETPEGKGHLVQDERFYRELKEDMEMNRRKYGKTGRKVKGRAKLTFSPSRGRYDLQVEKRSLEYYDQLIEQEAA
jgi:transposase